MVTKLYALRDSKVGEYNQPYSLVNDDVAKRMLSLIVNGDKESMLTKYPGDYDLYCIGSYDSVSGDISPVKPVHICSAASVVGEAIYS